MMNLKEFDIVATLTINSGTLLLFAIQIKLFFSFIPLSVISDLNVLNGR